MSWLSRAMNSITFSVIFYRTKFVVLNAALLSPPGETVRLQMLHVTVVLLSLSNLKYFHTADILSTGLPEYCVCVLPQIVVKKKIWVQNCSGHPYLKGLTCKTLNLEPYLVNKNLIDDAKITNEVRKYREAVWSLIYLTTCTRSDLSFVVS